MRPTAKKHSEILHFFALLVPFAIFLCLKSSHDPDENLRGNELKVTCSAGAQITSSFTGAVAGSIS